MDLPFLLLKMRIPNNWTLMTCWTNLRTPKLEQLNWYRLHHVKDMGSLLCNLTDLARSANLPKGLYILRSVISSFSFFTMSKAISVYSGPIFTIFSPNGRYLREFSWSSPVFPIPQGTLPWQPILCRTGFVRSGPNYLRIRWTDFHNLCTIW